MGQKGRVTKRLFLFSGGTADNSLRTVSITFATGAKITWYFFILWRGWGGGEGWWGG